MPARRRYPLACALQLQPHLSLTCICGGAHIGARLLHPRLVSFQQGGGRGLGAIHARAWGVGKGRGKKAARCWLR